MTERLLLWDRMVLESLNLKEKNLDQLTLDTSIVPNILKNILGELIKKGIVSEQKGIYKIKGDLNLIEDAIKEEVKDIFNSMVSLFYKNKSHIRLKKISLTQSEFEKFQMMLYSLEGFIEKISKEDRKKRLHEQRVIVWGHTKYAHLLDEI